MIRLVFPHRADAVAVVSRDRLKVAADVSGSMIDALRIAERLDRKRGRPRLPGVVIPERRDDFDGIEVRAVDPHQRRRSRGAEKGRRPAAVPEPGDAFGRRQVQLERLGFRRRVQGDFQPPARKFGRVRLIIGEIHQLIGFVDFSRLHQFLDQGVIEGLAADGGTFIPRVSAVEGKAQEIFFSPQQSAQQSVSERNRLVPGGDRRFQFQVQFLIRNRHLFLLHFFQFHRTGLKFRSIR